MQTHEPTPSPHEGWMSESASSLALAGFLGLVFVGFTLLAVEPLIALDAYFNLRPPPPSWLPVLHVLDRVGQRAVALPVLAIAAFWCARRQESWRPPVLALTFVLVLNLVVGLLKIGFGRSQPASADPSFFIGGMAYPSGHTANIVLVYGLCVYLLGHYGGLRRRPIALLWALVAGLSLVMVLVSLALNWHWFADLIAGLLVGGMVLSLAVAADAAVPRHAFDHGLRQGLRAMRGPRAGSEHDDVA